VSRLFVLHDRVTRFDPSLDSAFERTDLAESFVHHQAGDTRRARLVRSTAINDDFAVRRDTLEHSFDVVELDGNGPRQHARLRFTSKR
jgi:hypothetical protein